MSATPVAVPAPVAAPAPAGAPRGWFSLDRVLEVVKAAREGRWCWSRNSRCKYIELRIDMRDGHCQIRDRNGNLIDLVALQRQIS